MNSLIGKTPFLRLLLPVILGILVAAITPWETAYSIPLGVMGLAVMLLSYFVHKKRRYHFRWLFGAGLCFFLFALASFQYRETERRVSPNFPASECYFVGTLLDIPETKPRSMACHVRTTYPVNKRVILYLEKTDEARSLAPGDELLFLANLQPFQNMGNPDDFDYVQFMRIKGFSGTSYVPQSAWQKTGRQHITPSILSQRCRAKILDFYHSFGLKPDALAFISAITLGYKSYLSDDLQEAFRASGTAHVLAVSGLHVGIIYLVINFIFSFLGKRGWRFAVRQILIVITLWAYALIAGLSAPIIRAAFMLSIYCIGQAWNRAGFTYNTLAAAAFFLLLFKPFSLFDLSFQMSFIAVFAIVFFNPIIRRFYTPRNKALRYLWNMSTVSLSAQLGVFPLVLYHFGSFPTYFFIANLLVVPLLSLVIYAAIPLIVVSLAPLLHIPHFAYLESIFQWILGTLIEIVLRVVYITETLPYAQLTNKYLTLFQLILLTLFIFFFVQSFITRNSRHLLIALTAAQLFLMGGLFKKIETPPNRLVVYNSPSTSEIGFHVSNTRHFIKLPDNGLLPHPKKSILLLSDETLDHIQTHEPFPLDVLILSRHRSFDVNQLLKLFTPQIIVTDSSLPRYTTNRIQEECRANGVKFHDVSLHGAYSIYF